MEENIKLVQEIEDMAKVVKYEFHRLNDHLNRILTIDIPPEHREAFAEERLAFASDHWTTIHQVVDDVLEKTKKVVGFAKVLIWPVEIEGLETIYGLLKQDERITTIPAPLDRILTVIDGVLQVVDGSETVMKQANAVNNQCFFSGYPLFIPAGEVATYYVKHRTLYVTKFILKPEEVAV